MTKTDTFVDAVVNKANPRHTDAVVWLVWRTIEANKTITLHQLLRNLCDYQMIEQSLVRSALFSLTNPQLYNSVLRVHKPAQEGKPTYLTAKQRNTSDAWAAYLARVEKFEDFKLYSPVVFDTHGKTL